MKINYLAAELWGINPERLKKRILMEKLKTTFMVHQKF
jgi:hypothetical protein